jgi:hypothetical protein
MFKSLFEDYIRGQRSQEPSTFADHCRRIVKCAVYDGIYDIRDLEVLLIAFFGNETSMIESKSHTKVAVTATTDELPSTRLFTNYNGNISPQQDSGRSTSLQSRRDANTSGL